MDIPCTVWANPTKYGVHIRFWPTLHVANSWPKKSPTKKKQTGNNKDTNWQQQTHKLATTKNKLAATKTQTGNNKDTSW
jgi:hypothetical protein